MVVQKIQVLTVENNKANLLKISCQVSWDYNHVIQLKMYIIVVVSQLVIGHITSTVGIAYWP